MLLVGGLFLACGQEAPVLRADIPVRAEERSLLVGILRPNSVEVRAFPLVEGRVESPWMIGFEADEGLNVQVWTYTQTLGELRLSPGVQSFVTAGGRPLPTPSRVLSRPLADATLGEWTELPAPDPRLSGLRLPLSCTSFTVQEEPLPDQVRASFMVSSLGRLILGNLNGEVYWARPDGNFVLLGRGPRFNDAFAQSDGTIHLAAASGELWRATLSSADPPVWTATLAATLPDRDDVWFIVGDPAAGSEERYVATGYGLYRFQGGAYQLALSRNGPRALSWMGPGVVRGIYGYEYFVTGLEAGLPVEDNVHSNVAAGGMTALGWVPGFGGVGGVEYGTLYRRRGQDDWVPIEGLAPTIFQIRAVAPYVDSFVYARPDAIIEIVDGRGCDVYPTVLVPNDPDPAELGVKVEEGVTNGGRVELTVVGTDVAALGFRGRGQSPRLFWFRGPR